MILNGLLSYNKIIMKLKQLILNYYVYIHSTELREDR